MNFCPECDNLLYSTKGKLYCKSCKLYYSFKIIPEGVNDSGTNNDANTSNNNRNTKEEEIVIREDLKNLSQDENHYLHFFPYEDFRQNQENYIKQIKESADNRKVILLVAPNGTGKTIMALSSLLPIAIKKDLKIIYLCRTHSQNTRVIKELVKVSKYNTANNLNYKVNGLSIRGRNEMCLNKTLLSLKLNPRDSMATCLDLRKNRNCIHFLNLLKKKDNVDSPVLIKPELFNKPIDAEDLLNFCKDKKLCPYFLSKFLLEEMRVIICNYQWIFNPFIQESFLKFIGKELPNCILVVDECHNIIDVATDVNSERITPYILRLCLRDLEMYKSQVKMQSFVKILMNHLDKKKEKLFSEEVINPIKFIEMIFKKLGYSDLNQFKNFIEDLQDYSISIHEERLANGEISRDYIGHLAEFWLKWIETYHLDNYFFCYNIRMKKDKKSINIEIVALDPREIAVPIFKNCYTSLNLSGTVNPYVFNNLLGLNSSGKGYKGIIAGSPFKKKNIKALIIEGVDTRRENRTPAMFKKMNEKIHEVISCTPANIGIFCASYKILRGLLSNGLDKIVRNNNKKLFIEESGLTASENAHLVNDFKSMSTPPNNGAVLLGVCGGRNSEGEDYPGDYMNSVIIAGFPYHLPTPRVKAKIEYYNEVFKNQGWNFAYLYPAVQRANQASGRPIRKATDKGCLVFMDRRFKDNYQWISDWVKQVIEEIPDQKNAIIQNIYPFWNEG
jgi:DNA excision repair protein ERCC-2